MNKKFSPINRLNIFLISGTAIILLVALAVATILEYTFVHFELINWGSSTDSGWYWLFVFAGTSIIIGLLLAIILGKIIFKPLNTITDGMTKLADGDFSTRIDLGKYYGMKNLTGTFNCLAKELENNEVLRNDFVSDFSHELKTPIVSISGLITLMKNENLSDEKRRHYLAIMEEEANRLTQMTSNALYLSKIETQGILTNKNTYNVSEQIRSAVLLLERKWSKKDIEFSLDLDEYTLTANEDMLKQVWVNLIDNAIKFSEPRGEISLTARICGDLIEITVENQGPPIPKTDYELIFNKFYQCDKSRATEGNGIGLSIVKHIVNLHGGNITVACSDGKTAFTVTLPC